MLTFNDYLGFLFIGDPHLWSKSPGKRLDSSFMYTVLKKLEQAKQIAMERKLYPVILGDLFHEDSDHDPLMIVELMKILKEFPHPPTTIVGNHEKKQTVLTDDVAISIIKTANLLYTIEKNQIFAKFSFNGNDYYLGGTPYGQKIISDVSQVVSKKDAEKIKNIIWITHHDLAFNDTYPGAQPVQEIKGCFMAINGHIHQTKKPIKKGDTTWYNPGNITRLSTDCDEHIPSVWEWKPELKELNQIPLVFEKNIFNKVGQQIEATVKTPKMNSTYSTSEFVAMLAQHTNNKEQNRTSDGAYIKDNITALGQALGVDQEFIAEINSFAEDSILELDK